MLSLYIPAPALLLTLLSLPILVANGGPSKSPGPEVALYFVGPPRTLNTTLCSLLDNVVHPLLAQRCRLTFFVYTPNAPTVEQYDLLAAVPGVRAVRRVVDHPDPPPAGCVGRLNGRGRLHLNLFQRYNEELVAHIRDMEAVDRERLAFETEERVRFDWVLFVRPDVTYVSLLPRLEALPPTRLYVPPWLAWNGINDRFAIVPRQYTASYFHLYTALCVQGAVDQLPFNPRLNPEWIYLWHLNRSGVPLGPVPDFFFVRTRTYFTPYENLIPCDLSILGSNHCLLAFQYRCCRASLRGRRLAVSRPNCTRLGRAGATACDRIGRWKRKHQSPKVPCIMQGALGGGHRYGMNPHSRPTATPDTSRSR
eukprot:EG_transcript_12589